MLQFKAISRVMEHYLYTTGKKNGKQENIAFLLLVKTQVLRQTREILLKSEVTKRAIIII